MEGDRGRDPVLDGQKTHLLITSALEIYLWTDTSYVVDRHLPKHNVRAAVTTTATAGGRRAAGTTCTCKILRP